MSSKEREERVKQSAVAVKKISDVSVCTVRVHACVWCCGGGGGGGGCVSTCVCV